MKCYVLIVSENFPQTHPRAGEKTNFPGKIKSGKKIHTIRGNYELWKKRIDEIQAGMAYLSVRKWTGKPYKSKQEELFKFTDVGIQKVIKGSAYFAVYVGSDSIPSYILTEELANNDGLSEQDFVSWFENYPMGEPMAIVHFTKFRYV